MDGPGTADPVIIESSKLVAPVLNIDDRLSLGDDVSYQIPRFEVGSVDPDTLYQLQPAENDGASSVFMTGLSGAGYAQDLSIQLDSSSLGG